MVHSRCLLKKADGDRGMQVRGTTSRGVGGNAPAHLVLKKGEGKTEGEESQQGKKKSVQLKGRGGERLGVQMNVKPRRGGNRGERDA